MTHSLELKSPAKEAIELLLSEARLLQRWADVGGEWSTRQVDSMRQRARFLLRKAEELDRLNTRLNSD